MELALIAAYANDGVIGNGNEIPWVIPEDLRRFKKLTVEHSVIMGRKTYESILNKMHRSLPMRRNVVLSRDIDFIKKCHDPDGNVFVCSTLEEALDKAEWWGRDPTYVIGGQTIYEQTLHLPITRTLELTEVKGNFNGDTYFPMFDLNIWKEANRVSFSTKGKTPEYSFVTYQRL